MGVVCNHDYRRMLDRIDRGYKPLPHQATRSIILYNSQNSFIRCLQSAFGGFDVHQFLLLIKLAAFQASGPPQAEDLKAETTANQ